MIVPADTRTHFSGGSTCSTRPSIRSGAANGWRICGPVSSTAFSASSACAICTFLKVDPFYTAIFPGFRLAAPLGVEDFLAAHVGHFPGEAKGLRKVLELCAFLNDEVREFPSKLSLWDVVRMPKRFPRLFRYHDATLGAVMDAHLGVARLKALFAALWPYLGLPPSRLSFVYWAVMLQSFLEEGAF